MKRIGHVFFAILFTISPAARSAEVSVGGGRIDLSFSSPPTENQNRLVLAWIAASARAVATYYHHFPVPHVQVALRWFDGTGVRNGLTTGWNGPRIKLAVGRENEPDNFAEDWMLTHEFIHLAFPSVPEQNHWIEEGIATYVEPIARAQAGDLTPEKVWGDLVDGLPQGLPGPNDRGLDFTPTWGRTYWGGALFCLLADIDLRKRTSDKKGLEDALRAILEAGGTIGEDWPLSRALEVGDRATGTSVLEDLYSKMKGAPMPVDLNSLWQQLGVELRHGRIIFHEDAPLAAIRRAITRPTDR